MSPATEVHRRSPITDSPWFWCYVFATGALAALLLGGPRFFARQAQLDRQYTARQRAGQVVVGTQGPVPVAPSGTPLVSLKPLILAMAAVLSVAWIGLWGQRRGLFWRVTATNSGKKCDSRSVDVTPSVAVDTEVSVPMPKKV